MPPAAAHRTCVTYEAGQAAQSNTAHNTKASALLRRLYIVLTFLA
ncbi:hypothetical protein HMPREF9193_00632 [Treponema lecithinolyticum ATCC 700332]|uniref:Uncharacterized protein n=1 Tax=Treponema lecithinolyticum ATCC 700332 TaxID=1321815 RepID=A0ABN0P098_TRELE|nr:hypothetical protein HMPREF9193_00632 [Treponema lecithinolyticum ATCC 700332]